MWQALALHSCAVVRIKRDILAAKVPPSKNMGSHPHAGIPNPEQYRQKEEHA